MHYKACTSNPDAVGKYRKILNIAAGKGLKIVDLGAEYAIVNLGYSSVFQPLIIHESD